MKLKSLQVRNFKSLKQLDLSFPESGILVLVGANNAGKSNVVRSIDAICGDTWFSRDKLNDFDFYQKDRQSELSIKVSFDNGRSAIFSSNEQWPRYLERNGSKIWESKIKDDFPCVYLGADRTFDKHLSFYDWTLIGRIRRAFHARSGPIKGDLETKFSEIVDLFDRVSGFSDFKDDFTDFFSELQADTGAELKINFQPYTPSNYFKTLQIVATDPGSGSPIDLDELGEGSRNLALLALMRSFAKNLRANGEDASGILALEEPEIYMHPQAQRHLYSVLKDLAASGMQVIVTTHSTHFIDTEAFDSIGRVVQIPDDDDDSIRQTKVICVSKAKLVSACVRTGVPAGKCDINNIAPFYKTTSNANLNEGFFARALILVEGETEELALPVWLEHLGFNCNLRGVSIVRVNGKNQIPKYWRLFSSFDIPLVIVVDDDDDLDGIKRKSNQNLATCFGLQVEEICAKSPILKKLTSKSLPQTTIITLSRDYEASLKEDFEAWYKNGNSIAYGELEREAINLIRPIGNQNKGQIARYIAQGLVSRYPGFKPRLGESIFQELKNLGLVKPSMTIEPPV
jgi:putative ATP-dependent endonuclease of OLD family